MLRLILISSSLYGCLFPSVIGKVKLASSSEFPINYALFVRTETDEEVKTFENTYSEERTSIIAQSLDEGYSEYIYQIQLFASASKTIAENFLEDLREKGIQNACIIYIPPLYRIRVGMFHNYDQAKAFLSQIKGKGFKDAFIVEELKGRVSDTDCNR